MGPRERALLTLGLVGLAVFAGAELIDAAAMIEGEVRRNPEFFTDSNGVVHPIRHGEGIHKSSGGPYSERARVQKKKGKPATRKMDEEERLSGEAVNEIISEAKKHPERAEELVRIIDRMLDKGETAPFRPGGRAATISEMRRMRSGLVEIVEGRQKIQREITQIRQAQRDLYKGNLTTGDRKRAAPKYAELKRREEALLRQLP